MNCARRTLIRSAMLACCFLFLNLFLYANTWQWAKRGGGIFDGATIEPKESVVSMATDQQGNVYTLSVVEQSGGPDIDGHILVAYAAKDIVVSKFTCEGTYKWSKVIGGGNVDIPTAIGTDTLGHVYVSGKTYQDIPPYQVHFSTDSLQPTTNLKSLFLIQYDTSGNFKWLRQPNPDTATRNQTFTAYTHAMKVTPGGDVYWLVTLNPGLVSGGGGWAVPLKRPYILHYDKTGAMVSHIDLQMETAFAAFFGIFMEMTPDGKFIIAGGHDYYPGISDFSMGGQPITHSLFIGAFSPTGQFLWKKENTVANINSEICGKPVIDADGNIYLGGTFINNDVFNSYTHVNFIDPTLPVSRDPFICKLDPVGNLIWMKASSGTSANYTAIVTPKSNGELLLTGDYTSVWWDNTHGVESVNNGGTHLYAARFNTQGQLLGLDSLKGSPGSLNFLQSNTSDKNGNVFLGGNFSTTIAVNGQTIVNRGGVSDLFVVRYGVACNCTAPQAAFTKSISGKNLSLTYNGTTTNLDSVVWDFGNSITSTKTGTAIGTAFTYTYPTAGTYNVCVTAYNSCGSDQNCQQVATGTLGITELDGGYIDIYPNPAQQSINISGMEQGEASIVTIDGKLLSSFSVKGKNYVKDIRSLAPGIYMLKLRNKEGQLFVTKIVKQ